MKYFVLIIGVLAIFLLAVMCQKHEQPYRFFNVHSEELYRGNWVPKIFPDDISEIHEQHDIDTNEVWLSFNRGKKSINPFVLEMKSLSSNQIEKLEMSKPFMASWWFEGPIQKQPANDNALNAVFFKGVCGKEMTSYLALDNTSKKSYWWCQY